VERPSGTGAGREERTLQGARKEGRGKARGGKKEKREGRRRSELVRPNGGN